MKHPVRVVLFSIIFQSLTACAPKSEKAISGVWHVSAEKCEAYANGSNISPIKGGSTLEFSATKAEMLVRSKNCEMRVSSDLVVTDKTFRLLNPKLLKSSCPGEDPTYLNSEMIYEYQSDGKVLKATLVSHSDVGCGLFVR